MQIRPWAAFAVVGILATSLSAPLGVTVQDTTSAIFAVATLAIIVRSVRRYQPPSPAVWYVLVASIALFLLAGAVAVLTEEPGVMRYPDIPDYIDLVAYAGTIVVGYLLLRTRTHVGDRTNLIDAVVGVGAVGVLIWVYVMVPYLTNDGLALSGRLLSALFSLLSLSLCFVIARVAMGPGARNTSYYLMAVGAACALASDVMASILLSDRPVPINDGTATLVSSIGIIVLGAAALHPDMVRLTEPGREKVQRLTRSRLLVMGAAAMVPPAVLVTRIRGQSVAELSVIVAIWALLSALIMARMAGLVRARERLAWYDRVLSTAGADLVAATDRLQMSGAALEALVEITRRQRPPADAAVLTLVDGEWHLNTADAERIVDDAAIEAFHPATLPRGETRVFEHVPRPDGAGPAPWLAATGFHAFEEGQGALLVMADAALAPEALDAIRSLGRELSLAHESAALTESVHRQRSERRFRSLVENSGDVVLVVDDRGHTIYTTPSAGNVLGYSESTLVGGDFRALVAPVHLDTFEQLMESVESSEPVTGEIQVRHADNTFRWFEMIVSDLRDDPEVGGTVVTMREVTERKQAEQRLARSEARFRSLVQYSSDIVAVLDETGTFSYVSPSVKRALGYSAHDLLNTSLVDLVDGSDRSTLSSLFHRLRSTPLVPQRDEVKVRSVDGTTRILEMTLTDLRKDQSILGIVLNAHDITARKTLEHDLRHQALHDDLTELPNRVLLRDRIDQALNRRTDRQVAMMVIDLDDFKTVNDGLGHEVGDELLKVIAFRIRQFVRGSDTAARLGGDEFAILLEEPGSREAVLTVARRILGTVQDPIEVDGRDLRVGGSIGVAFVDDVHDPNAEVMLRSADMAMYSAKSRGKNRIAVFDESMHVGAFERLELKSDLGNAQRRGELLLHYQPIVALDTGRVAGFEALMRWQHPERGMVSPGAFIPLAEETGLIVEMGRWLLDEAFGRVAEWQRRFPSDPPLGISVNLSARQLEEDRIVDDIAAAIDRAGIPASSVTIELTESILVDGSGPPRERLERIRELGVALVADDFGSGYASYASLQQMPFTGLKIDMSLIRGLADEESERATAQIRSILQMAAAYRFSVVAEGVESHDQVATLEQLRCDKAQGYFFARPMDPDAVVDLLLGAPAAV